MLTSRLYKHATFAHTSHIRYLNSHTTPIIVIGIPHQENYGLTKRHMLVIFTIIHYIASFSFAIRTLHSTPLFVAPMQLIRWTMLPKNQIAEMLRVCEQVGCFKYGVPLAVPIPRLCPLAHVCHPRAPWAPTAALTWIRSGCWGRSPAVCQPIVRQFQTPNHKCSTHARTHAYKYTHRCGTSVPLKSLRASCFVLRVHSTDTKRLHPSVSCFVV